MYRVLCLACGGESTLDVNGEGESTIAHVAECPGQWKASGLEVRDRGREIFLIDARGVRLLQVKRIERPAAAVVGRLELGV